jgi:hypothetical protein
MIAREAISGRVEAEEAKTIEHQAKAVPKPDGES